MFVGDENKLVKLKKILDQKHFNTSMNLDKINTLQVFYSTVLELDTITDLSHFLYKMSEDYQVKYDGWGTKV
jgi:regulator of RNase E activity RraB